MKKTYLIIISLLTLSTINAQKPSKKMIDEMSIIVADQIRANYVLPEKGEEIAKYFELDTKNGRFYQAKDLKQLDSIMCKSLREVSKDFHLFVWNNTEIVEQLRSESNEEEEKETTNFFSDKMAFQSNFGFQKIEILSDNIGYIKLSSINISDLSLKILYSSMSFVSNTDALIIDLRDNGGGGSTIGPVLETFFFNSYVELLEFKSRNGQVEISSTVGWLLEERYLKPLYLLINKGTASAAEAFAFALQNQGRCTIIGQPSSGGAYMNSYFPVNDEFIVAISTAAPFIPGTTESWEGKGVQPDYFSEGEDVLIKALEVIRSGK